jgi:hypothetical protein
MLQADQERKAAEAAEAAAARADPDRMSEDS